MPGPLRAVHERVIACEACPRLRAYCTAIAETRRAAFRNETYWARPVPGFGDARARMLVLGLAPAAHGANRTGRVFTGDGTGGSGDFLMTALHGTGFANLTTSSHVDDGLRLSDAYIAAAVRCAPPGNKPIPEEISRCLDHLEAEVRALPNIQVVIALGKIAFDAWLQMLRRNGVAPTPRPQFGHGVVTQFDADVKYLVGCYHPSRQNTNTGKLTPRMMHAAFSTAKALMT